MYSRTYSTCISVMPMPAQTGLCWILDSTKNPLPLPNPFQIHAWIQQKFFWIHWNSSWIPRIWIPAGIFVDPRVDMALPVAEMWQLITFSTSKKSTRGIGIPNPWNVLHYFFFLYRRKQKATIGIGHNNYVCTKYFFIELCRLNLKKMMKNLFFVFWL